jgi:hypothetical protein
MYCVFKSAPSEIVVPRQRKENLSIGIKRSELKTRLNFSDKIIRGLYGIVHIASVVDIRDLVFETNHYDSQVARLQYLIPG